MGKNEFLILFNLLISQLLIILIGYPVVLFIFRRKTHPTFLAKISFAYGIGTAVITLEMLFFAFCKIPFSFRNLLIPWVLTHPLFFWYLRREKSLVLTSRSSHLSDTISEGRKGPVDFLRYLAQVIILLLIIFQIYCFTIYTFSTPLYEWDEFTNWALKAKICFLEKTIPVETFEIDRDFKYRHDYYPLLVPLAQAWIYISLDAVNDWLGKLLFPLFFSFLICSFYYFLRKLFFSKLSALLFTLFLITNGVRWINYSTISVADLPMEFFYTLGVLNLYLWISFPDKNEFLILSSIFSGVSLWTKIEGIPMVAINILILICYCMIEKGGFCFIKDKKIQLYFAIILLFFTPWMIYLSMSGVSFAAEHINQLRFERSFLILKMVLRDMGCTFCWGIIWYVFVIALCLNVKKIFSTNSVYLLGIIVLNLFLILLSYVVTQHEDVAIQIDATLRRLLLHIIPLIVFFSCIQIKEVFKNHFQHDI